jgi:hypothetical protein
LVETRGSVVIGGLRSLLVVITGLVPVIPTMRALRP